MRRLCSLHEIPEEGIVKIDLGDKQLLVARWGGRVFAADTWCTHEEADLSLGLLSEGTVVCPLHRARFRLKDGAVLEGPEGDPPESIPPLRTHKVRVEGAEVYLVE